MELGWGGAENNWEKKGEKLRELGRVLRALVIVNLSEASSVTLCLELQRYCD